MLTAHPYAALLRAIADGQAAEFQTSNGDWVDIAAKDALEEIVAARYSPKRLRIKPDTLRIASHELTAPMRVAPSLKTRYFTPYLSGEMPANSYPWDGDSIDRRNLQRGLCFASEADAVAVAAALLGLLQPSGVQA